MAERISEHEEMYSLKYVSLHRDKEYENDGTDSTMLIV